jgi:preprotein translocase subunit YajC
MRRKLDVIESLRNFNNFFDAFILEAAKPLAMLGFAMGTVDIFTRGGMAPQSWFAVSWAIIQAITIDGLFFAVWYRLFGLRWKPGERVAILALTLIGLVLGVVVIVTNTILGFQQAWGISDSQTAMVRLGIDPGTFTLTRAFLVVIVAVMVAFVYQRRQQNDQLEVTEEAKMVRQGAEVVAELASDLAELAEEKAKGGLLLAEKAEEVAVLADKEAIMAAMAEGRPLNLTKLAGESGIPRSTLRNWKARVSPINVTGKELNDG